MILATPSLNWFCNGGWVVSVTVVFDELHWIEVAQFDLRQMFLSVKWFCQDWNCLKVKYSLKFPLVQISRYVSLLMGVMQGPIFFNLTYNLHVQGLKRGVLYTYLVEIKLIVRKIKLQVSAD